MREADYIIDMGPGAGVHGGKVCAEGDFEKIIKDKKSITAKFLSKKNFILGSGDDSAIFRSTNYLCYSVDQNYEGVHFPKSLPPEFIATRSVLRSFSDISAMGGKPLWFSVALACDFDEKFINDFSRGLIKVSNLLSVPLIGGDLIKTHQKSVTVSVSGETKKNNHLSRSGAKHNQNIYLTGELGLARKGLEEIKKKFELKDIYKNSKVNSIKSESDLITIFYNNTYYDLLLKEEYVNDAHFTDTQIIDYHIFNQILKIRDTKQTERVKYIESSKIELFLNQNPLNKNSLLIFTKTIDSKQLMQIADNNLILPPKSTYIEPKIRSGITIYDFKS